ncbi:hypothetical protein U8V72_11615 [Priestia filamentosa]|uniref:hypothetical protein n=1 Tax=Priestia filamentosa TaxID=1402861 RepID=UPI00397BF560
MSLDRLTKVSRKAVELKGAINLNELILDEIKNEDIYPYYLRQKKDSIALDNDFKNIVINGVILQERKNIKYNWLNAFYEEAEDRGIIHTVLKHGNKLKERFDLSSYKLLPSKDAASLGYTPSSKSYEEIEKRRRKLELERAQWKANSIEKSVEKYMSLKKINSLKKNEYQSLKEELFKLMQENDVQKTEEGFYIKNGPITFDFSKMYQVPEFIETVLIATNGYQSVDLFYTDKIVKIDLIEEDLEDVEYINKRYGAKRIAALKEALGDNFYYVRGYRKEKNILTRFPISTEKVEEAINNGWLPITVLQTYREIQSVDDITLGFEIISESAAKERAEINYQKYMNRALIHSGYYDK